jgi:hypothetical protein
LIKKKKKIREKKVILRCYSNKALNSESLKRKPDLCFKKQLKGGRMMKIKVSMI